MSKINAAFAGIFAWPMGDNGNLVGANRLRTYMTAVGVP